MDYPLAMLLVSLALQWAAAHVGDFLRVRGRALESDERTADVQGATTSR